MPTTVYPNCPCCGPASGSGRSGTGSGSGGRRYTTCNQCFGVDRPIDDYPTSLTVTYIDHGNATAVMVGGGPGIEYIADAPSIPYLMGMYAQTAVGCLTGAEGWFFRGCTIEGSAPLQMISCDPMVLYGATPFGTVVVTEDGSSPAYPSLGSLVPGCDGISGTLDVTTSGGPGCLPASFSIVRVAPGIPVECNHWEATNTAPDCSCPGTTFALECTGADPGTWVATYGGSPMTLTGQTAAPFSLTFTLDSAVAECGTEIPAGTTFVVTEP